MPAIVEEVLPPVTGPKKRVSYVIHWTVVDPTAAKDDDYYRMPYSLVFDHLDERLVEKIIQIKKNPYVDFGPIVEKIVHSELNLTEKQKLERMLNG